MANVKNCKVHYGASHTTMSGYDCRNKCVFSFRRNDNSDVAEVTSRGRVFQILGPAVANERSPTVTRRDGRMLFVFVWCKLRRKPRPVVYCTRVRQHHAATDSTHGEYTKSKPTVEVTQRPPVLFWGFRLFYNAMLDAVARTNAMQVSKIN